MAIAVPDLNPIENLWWDLKKAVAVRKPKNVTEGGSGGGGEGGGGGGGGSQHSRFWFLIDLFFKLG